ncbi:MAG: UDP-N-acetylmuramoyl-L-alanyl-D-glutamate--2,6-diaminopimelate ligase [Saprospiraceae bacterium]|nr:UDP-N-acetylmuramoyl-L-alanyl-D-glutamate--2,6-diaminopimelate ligase [Saprospiraceae bacterium]
MKIKKLFDILPVGFEVKIVGNDSIDITGISLDSRKIERGYIYAALKGTLSDGHNYIDKAIENGAICILCEKVDEVRSGVTYIIINDVRTYLGDLVNHFYDHASDSLKLVGVTGTNGKTTVSTLLFQLFAAFGYKCGLISTVENRIGDEVIPATHTTPDVVNLHKLIAQMRDEKCEYIFMEVSSHAVDQKRIAGLKFEGALFTNITHDHLDYHLTMKNYIAAKKKFFDDLLSDAFALVNNDDKNGSVMLQNTKAKKLTFGLRTMSDYKVKIIESSVQGLHLKINDREAYFRLIGEFNAYNLALVYGAARELGMESDDILAVLSGLRGAEGRFDQVVDKNTGKCGIIDYAHTPDALENVLETIKKVKNIKSQIITVVGCGGDRDATKRPIMAKVACTWSDKVILTSDNPRSEDPDAIIDEMEAGLDIEDKKKMIRITDRQQAIKTAVMISNNDDILLIAGKGHETYQEIKGEKFPFDDKKILKEFLGLD